MHTWHVTCVAALNAMDASCRYMWAMHRAHPTPGLPPGQTVQVALGCPWAIRRPLWGSPQVALGSAGRPGVALGSRSGAQGRSGGRPGVALESRSGAQARSGGRPEVALGSHSYRLLCNCRHACLMSCSTRDHIHGGRVTNRAAAVRRGHAITSN
eukprot:350497-Chlamydomonas_euryale.AAC.2